MTVPGPATTRGAPAPPGARSPALEPLAKRLASKTPPAVVAAAGEEAWLREDAVRLVAEAVLGSADSPDLVTLRADDPSKAGMDEVLPAFFGEVRTGNLFGGAKVVVLRGAGEAVRADEKAFLAWLAAPSGVATAVLVADDLPAAVTAAVAKHGIVVACGGRNAPRDPPARFAVRQAAARGKRLGTDEAEMLVDLVGDDLGALDNALEVLSLHAGDEPAIDAAAIRALFPGARQGVAEEVATAIVEGRTADALALAARCFDEGVPEAWGSSRIARDERTVAMTLTREIGRTLLRTIDARRQLDAGVPRGEVRLGTLPPFLRDRFVRIASQRREGALESLLLALEETDRGMKSGGAQGRVALVRLATAAGRYK